MTTIRLTIGSIELADARSALGYLDKARRAVGAMKCIANEIGHFWKGFKGTSIDGFKMGKRHEVREFYDEANIMIEYCNSSLASLGMCFSMDFDDLLSACYKKIDEFNPKKLNDNDCQD